MSFQIGDKVIHLTHGLGEIIRIEERYIHDIPTKCYVVSTPELMIWIPVDDMQQHNLRLPTPPEDFVRLFDILSSPSEKLLDDRLLRKDQLLDRMKDGQLASIFKVVRDLTHMKHSSKLNDREKSILEWSMNSLLTEWAYSLGVSLNQAKLAMMTMLGE
jgi:RNA polymerase-interacting CarD/CdnL/TRCF family regulator